MIAPSPLFFVSVDSKWFSLRRTPLESTLAEGLAGVDSKQLICNLIV